MFNKQTIRDVDLEDQVVLVRTDYNVPIKNGKITDDLRIRASLPTLEYLKKHHAAKIIVISHLGRPGGRVVPELSLKPVAARLKTLLPKTPVEFVDDDSGPDVEAAVDALPEGGILLLENLRFNAGEEENSEEFAHELASSTHADLFVQDGFAVVHRAHASTDAITKLLPAVAGLLVEKEISALSKVIENPTHPLALVIGGAKVEDKQPLIDKFKPLADEIIVAGKIAADGYKSDDKNIYVAEDFDEDAEGKKLDIGPVATAKITELLKPMKTIIWNGVLGKVEDPTYATSSTILAVVLGERKDVEVIICGGDTTGFVESLEHDRPDLKYTLVSTGGGAALEFLLGDPLPGVDALEDK